MLPSVVKSTTVVPNFHYFLERSNYLATCWKRAPVFMLRGSSKDSDVITSPKVSLLKSLVPIIVCLFKIFSFSEVFEFLISSSF